MYIDNISRSNEYLHIQWRTYIFRCLKLKLLYVGPFAARNNRATTTNKVKRTMNKVLGGIIDNGPYIDPFPISNEVWITGGIFFNGIVPW